MKKMSRKILSVFLSVAMVFGMLPMFAAFAVSVAPESLPVASALASDSEFPELVITEMAVNTVNFDGNADSWRANWPAEIGAYSMPAYKEQYYLSANPKVGASVSGLYTKTVDGTGKVTYTSASGTAVAGTQYYLSVNSNQYYDVFRYIEVYNASDHAINLYDYKLAYDSDAATEGTSVRFNQILPGGVAASYHADGFEHASVPVGASLAGYYTRSGASYTPCAASATAVAGGAYYRAIENEYFVTNPSAEEGAWLQPGKCAVLWMYFADDVWGGGKTQYFKYHYEQKFANREYHLDFSDVLFLGVSCMPASSYANYYGSDESEFELATNGERYYGIVKKDMDDRADTSRENKWTSWVRWDEYVGLAVSNPVLVETVAGTTQVVTGAIFYYDVTTGQYLLPQKGYGADINGNALSGINYYKLDSNFGSRNAQNSNYYDQTCTNFLYGIDATKSIKAGTYYTAGGADITLGFLTLLQQASFPNGSGQTGRPDLVITEVMPDNKGKDYYPYLEIVNTSGGTINLFDYSVLGIAGRTTFNPGVTAENFNAVSHLIPGNVGNILSADASVHTYTAAYQDAAPTNVEYDGGWLAPGEVALIWGYSADAFFEAKTFADFYNYYNLDSSVKVFAMDGDNSAASGRKAVGISATVPSVYGIVKNSNLTFPGALYRSKAEMNPLVYPSGECVAATVGLPTDICESFVVTNSAYVIARASSTLGEEYGYQFVWDLTTGSPNRLGAYLAHSYMSRYGSSTEITFATVLSGEWTASPAVLVGAQKTAFLAGTAAAQYVVYLSDFASQSNASGYSAVARTLGIAPVANDALATAHSANLDATESAGAKLLELKNGKLIVTNNGQEAEYLLLASADALRALGGDEFTVEFTLDYLDSKGENAFATVLYGFNAADASYVEAGVTADGKVFNRLSFSGVVQDLVEPVDAALTSGVSVRITSSAASGTRVYLDGTLISDTASAASAQFSAAQLFKEDYAGGDVVLKVMPGVSAAFADVAVYGSGVTASGAAAQTPALIISEILTDGGNDFYAAGVDATLDRSFVRYIELTNSGNTAVALADYAILRTAEADSGLFLTKNALSWGETAITLADWLSADQSGAYVADGSGAVVVNPTAAEAILAPGESALVFFVNSGDFARFAAQSLSLKSLVDCPETTVCITVGEGLTVSDGVAGTPRTPAAFPLKGEDAIYGVGVAAAGRTWAEIGTHDTRVVVSAVDYNLAAFGADRADTTGCPVQYYYGLDGSVSPRIGVVAEKALTPLWTVYQQGTATVARAGQYNAGRLLSLQATYLADLRDFAKNGHVSGGGLVITEYVPVTTDDRDGARNAFSAIEVTNTSDRAINLYSYAITTAAAGCSNTWTAVSALRGGQLVGKTHKWYSQLQSLANNENGVLQPGATAVIWFFTEETYALAGDQPARGVVSVEDFRNYWAAAGSAAMTLKARDGSYTVPVIVCVVDGERSALGLASEGIATIGITASSSLQFGNVTRAECVISRVSAPIDNSYRVFNRERMLLTAHTAVFYPYKDTPVEFATGITLGDSAATLYRFRHYILCDDAAVAVAGETYYWQTGLGGQNNYQGATAYAVGDNAKGLYHVVIEDNDQVMTACADDETVAEGITYYYGPYDNLPVLMAGDSLLGYYTYDAEGRLALCDADEIVRADRTYYSSADATEQLVIGSTEDVTGYFAGGIWQTGTVLGELDYAKRQITWTGESEAIGATPDDLAACFVKIDDQTFEFAAGTYPENTVFYHLYYNITVEETEAPVNTSYQFVYPASHGGWNLGAAQSTIKMSSRLADAEDVSSVTLDIVSISAGTASLGQLNAEQNAAFAAASFTEIGVLQDGTKLYFHESVMDGLENAGIYTTDAAISTANGTAISFKGMMKQSFYRALTQRFGSTNVSFGMYQTVATNLRGAAGILNVAEKTADSGLSTTTSHGEVLFGGSEQAMPADHYRVGMAGVAYATVTMPVFGTVTIVSKEPVCRTVTQVLASAMLDSRTESSEEYCYEVGDGTWSRYTASQRARFAAFLG